MVAKTKSLGTNPLNPNPPLGSYIKSSINEVQQVTGTADNLIVSSSYESTHNLNDDLTGTNFEVSFFLSNSKLKQIRYCSHQEKLSGAGVATRIIYGTFDILVNGQILIPKITFNVESDGFDVYKFISYLNDYLFKQTLITFKGTLYTRNVLYPNPDYNQGIIIEVVYEKDITIVS